MGLFGRPLLQVRGLNGIGHLSRFISKKAFGFGKSDGRVGGVGGGVVGVGGMFMKTRRGERGVAPTYIPKTENQKKFVEALDRADNKLVVVLGPAGTGKTLFSCLRAIQDLKAGVVKKIVITRPVVTVEEDIGFLPGSLRHKMDPWMQPIFDVFQEFYSKHDIECMIQTGVIEISPLAFMRGRTFKNCFILADEMQNSSPNQMLMLLTRIGDGSRMVVGGDLNQSDRLGMSNGLAEFVLRYRRALEGGDDEDIKICQMANSDVERSPIVAKILRIFGGDDDIDMRGSPNTTQDKDKELEEWNYIMAQPEYNYHRTEDLQNSKPDTISSNDSAIIPKKDFFSKNRPLW